MIFLSISNTHTRSLSAIESLLSIKNRDNFFFFRIPKG